MTTQHDLVAFRRKFELTTRSAPELIGCSREAWRRWENGTSHIPLYIGLALAALNKQLKPYTRRQTHNDA